MANADGLPQSGPMLGTKDGDGDIIQEAKERFQLCLDAEDRAEAMEDLRFRNGDQWDEEAVRQRELDSRPCLTMNNVPAIIHQVTNDVRQNKQSIQVHPVDDGADPEVAEVIEGLIRHVEYDSGADAAYDTAIDLAASIGFGFFRLVTEYSSPMAFTQDMKIKRVRNPFTVHIDPNAQEADSSDMQFAFVSSRLPTTQFNREHPDASATSQAIGTAIGDNDNWLWPDYIRIAEYYRIEYETATIVLLGDGTTKLESELKPLEHVVAKRVTQIPKVMWYKITGAEVLERTEIPCKWIPIFPVYGDEVDIDGQLTRSGIIRNLKLPKQMENYWLTSATEEIALRTKTPFIGALGQFEGIPEWNDANTKNYPFLEYNPVSVEGSLAPAPQRQPPADVPIGFIQMANIARDTVKAVTGIYDASLGNRSNETSGLAIRARQAQGDIANFHFTDNLTRAMRHLGRCMIDMIPKVYDTQRVVRILGEDRKTADHVEINKPGTKDDGQGNAIATVLNDLTVGTYDVVVTTGPAFNTLREEAVANMIELGGKWPKLMDVAGDKIVKAMDWPGAEEIAERLEKTLPPGLADDDDAPQMVQTPKGPIPAQQAGQLIGQMDQALAKMQEDLEKLESGVTIENVRAASREAVAEINAQAKKDDTELAGMIQLLLAGQGNLAEQIAAFRDHAMSLDEMNEQARTDHVSAVAAAADPLHPAPPADKAQAAAPTLDQSSAPADAPEPDTGTVSAPTQGA